MRRPKSHKRTSLVRSKIDMPNTFWVFAERAAEMLGMKKQRQLDVPKVAAAEGERRIAAFWNRIARKQFAVMPGSTKIAMRLDGEILKSTSYKPRFNAASIGSGFGLFEIFLAKRFEKANFTCFDLSKRMNQSAREIAQRFGVQNIHFITKRPGRPIRLKGDSQDVFLSLHSEIEHRKGFGKSMQVIWSALKPGGNLFILTEGCGRSDTIFRIRNQAKKLGFVLPEKGFPKSLPIVFSYEGFAATLIRLQKPRKRK